MSIRKVNKKHLKKHAGVQMVGPERVEPPTFDDPLVFWTLHPKTPSPVDLRPFATGQDRDPRKGNRKGFKAFSGRPELLMQLLPVLKEKLLYAPGATVRNYFHSLRAWWRILDEVEASAAKAGEPMHRLTDARLLSPLHADAVHRSGMRRAGFTLFKAIVDATRMALGGRQTYWEVPEDDDSEKHIPPEDQRKALRIEVKRQCYLVLAHWDLCDELKRREAPPQPEFPEQSEEHVKLWRAARHLKKIQEKTGKTLPSGHELNNEQYHSWTNVNLGVGVQTIRGTAFPSGRDACAVFTQCLINTPWNSSTLLTLDVRKQFLFNHFKDDPSDSHRRWILAPETYELVGEKERADGKEQFVMGMWRTRYGPGHLITTYLARVEPLRNLLKEHLAEAKQQYQAMQDAGVGSADTSAQFAEIKRLEQGCASVWLHIGQKGEIGWLDQKFQSGYVNGEKTGYLVEVRHHLNAARAARNEAPIPYVSPKDFRVWYADYVYRYGNLLAVQKALNHSQLRTSVRYTNTNILNQEASDSARRFLDILISELDKGRVDLTILAHLHRHGPLTAEQERQLTELRALPKSRQGVGCKDAYHPPKHLKATPDSPCDVQRCLLCVEHAVLLPESLDGIAMREAELHALQGFLAATVWVSERYDIELENHKQALRRFDLNQVMAARRKWAEAIACGRHLVLGIPSEELPRLMELA